MEFSKHNVPFLREVDFVTSKRVTKQGASQYGGYGPTTKG